MINESENTLTRPHLESLSTGELIELADSLGLDIPAELDRIFIIEELLENNNYANSHTEKKNEPENEPEDIQPIPAYLETAALPKQYNISFIEVIVRDPLWIFVHWEIKNHDRDLYEKVADFNGYYLRVVPQDKSDAVFTVHLDKDDNARYLGFPEQSAHDHFSYIIKLYVDIGETEKLITESAPFNLPKLIDNAKINELAKHPLINLSGVRNISITKCIDRTSRAREH